MAYSAYITTIKELRPHGNADRLNIATIFGEDVIVDKSYYIGQRVIYFPADGQLSEQYAKDNNLVRRKDENGNNVGGYLDSQKRNVKAIKLRGEKSEGMVMPIETLAAYGDIESLQDGDAITKIGETEICRKYIPLGSNHGKRRSGSNAHKEKKILETMFPFFAEHIDTEQLAFNEGAFRREDTIYLTRKLHGTSARTANTVAVTKRRTLLDRILRREGKEVRKYTTVSGSRRRIIGTGNSYYGSDDFREKWDQYFAAKLPRGVEIFYEIVGWANENTPIMPPCQNKKVNDPEFTKQYGDRTVFTYGCPEGENQAYVYRMTYTNDDGDVFEFPTEMMFGWCEMHDVPHVPLLEKFLFTTWEDLRARVNKYLDVPEPLADDTHVVEGVVVRIDNRMKFTAFKDKSMTFKILEGVIKESSDAPDMEEMEEATEVSE